MVDERRERGSILPLGAIALAIGVLAVVLLVELGARAVNRAQAQAAADMAALAGVFEGRSGAVDLAQRNGAILVGYLGDGDVVWVRVAVGSASAEARARFDVGPP